MSEEEVDVSWILKGCQKKAVVSVIKKPMTNSEIVKAAKQQANHIERWDVTKILRKCMEHGIVYCINPDDRNGRLYWLTDYGKRLVTSTFGFTLKPCSKEMDWRAYAFVVSAPVRKRLLLEFHELYQRKTELLTAGVIRKILQKKQCSISLNQILRAMNELKQKRFLRCAGFSTKRRLRMYCITLKGRLIANELLR